MGEFSRPYERRHLILAIRPRSDTDFSLARVAVRRKDIVHVVVAFAPFSHGSAMRARAKFMVDAFAMTS